MSTLVGELLSFSKARVEATSAQIRAVNVAETVDRVLLRESTPESMVHVQIDRALEVIAAPDHLFRALANVVRNAIRYAGAAGAIEISAAAAHHGRVQIKVADCGPGVPDTEVDNLFRPFYRPEFARQRETGAQAWDWRS